ncbi:RDD family protein [Chitinophaga sp. HK235]|uniref:RDD family protein n=1 Tax=Chitinophaga sp. HK235 TaxID=2952571 RepID=UPI001BAAE955|nr:RDD family protein [Chitinophaga sp. HK235]
MESFKDTKTTDLLSDLQEAPAPEEVSKGIRFAGFIIDYLIVIAICVGIVLFIPMGEMEIRLVFTLVFILYYSIMEGLTGRTIGKMLTGTRVVTLDYERISFGQVMGRSFSRIIPFEPFSMLFGPTPWHDMWTNTTVVKNK